MRTYKIWGTAAASANNVAYITLQRNCRIRGIRWAVNYDATADNSACRLVLSFSSANSIGVNDSTGDFDQIDWYLNVGAAGAYPSQNNLQRSVDIPTLAGERVYLHCVITTTTFVGTVFIDVEE